MNIAEASKNTHNLVAHTKVIPVLGIEDARQAQAIAEALVAGGLNVLEVTLRTDQALAVIEAMAKVEGAIVGSGTILTKAQLQDAKNAGAQFNVSPGATEKLIDASIDLSAPLLPGAATASEVMRLLEYGYSFMKFFPAQASGGVDFLRALSSPLSQAKFCPTGGITANNVNDYLRLPNVVCAGGSWLVNQEIIANKDWAKITALAKQVA